MSTHFSDKELNCQHCGEAGMDPAFIEVLEKIRVDVGFPMPITSGYRCPNHPLEAKKSSPGAHAQGRAVDVAVSRSQAFEVIKSATAHGITGLGVDQKGDGRFLHLDIAKGIARPAIWSY